MVHYEPTKICNRGSRYLVLVKYSPQNIWYCYLGFALRTGFFVQFDKSLRNLIKTNFMKDWYRNLTHIHACLWRCVCLHQNPLTFIFHTIQNLKQGCFYVFRMPNYSDEEIRWNPTSTSDGDEEFLCRWSCASAALSCY